MHMRLSIRNNKYQEKISEINELKKKKKSFGHLQKKYMVYKVEKIIFSLDFPGATPYVKRK